MQLNEIIHTLKSLSNPKSVEGMARYGISPHNTLGVSVPNLRKLARQAGKDHALAQQLWNSGIHEARVIASMIDDPKLVTTEQMESWVKDFDSWDVCDQVCMNLFARTALSFDKAFKWSASQQEFVKRAGFALIACLAWNNKEAKDDHLAAFLPVIEREAGDDRNYVKKAVNWALRQIGKRNYNLNKLAIEAAERIKLQGSKSARWIAADALRELTSKTVHIKYKG